MNADKLLLVLLARIAGEVNPESYVDTQSTVVPDPKAVASRNVRVYTEMVDLGHKDDEGNSFLTPVTKREITLTLFDGSETITVE